MPAASPVVRLEFVDSLRGLAALYVVFFHLSEFKVEVPETIYPVVHAGASGVCLFYVASAFTLCHALRSRQGEPRATSRFYVRRVFRIVPLYYVWLAVFVGLQAWQSGHPLNWVAIRKGELLLYLTFTFNFAPGRQWGIVPASWSLGVEMVFYAVFPLLFRLVTSIRRAVVFVILSLAASYIWTEAVTAAQPPDWWAFYHVGILHHVPSFAVGMLAYYALPALRGRVGGGWFLAAFVAGYIVVLGYNGIGTPNAAAWGAVFALLLLGLGLWPVGIFVNRLTRFLGTISYSLYLNHIPLIMVWLPVFRRIEAAGFGPWVTYPACAAVELASLIALSVVTYRLIERPGMGAGNRIVRRMGARVAGKEG